MEFIEVSKKFFGFHKISWDFQRFLTQNLIPDEPRIVHDYENLLFLSKSPQSKALPANWNYICDKIPSIVKQEVIPSDALIGEYYTTNKFDKNNNLNRMRFLKKSYSCNSAFSSSFDMSLLFNRGFGKNSADYINYGHPKYRHLRTASTNSLNSPAVLTPIHANEI